MANDGYYSRVPIGARLNEMGTVGVRTQDLGKGQVKTTRVRAGAISENIVVANRFGGGGGLWTDSTGWQDVTTNGTSDIDFELQRPSGVLITFSGQSQLGSVPDPGNELLFARGSFRLLITNPDGSEGQLIGSVQHIGHQWGSNGPTGAGVTTVFGQPSCSLLRNLDQVGVYNVRLQYGNILATQWDGATTTTPGNVKLYIYESSLGCAILKR